jgi:hypothetical protein
MDLHPEVIRLATRDNPHFMMDLYRGLSEMDLSPLAPQLNLEEATHILAMQYAHREHVTPAFSLVNIGVAKKELIKYFSWLLQPKNKHAYEESRPQGSEQDTMYLPLYKELNPYPDRSLPVRLANVPQELFIPLKQQFQAPRKEFLSSQDYDRRVAQRESVKNTVRQDFIPGHVTRENWLDHAQEVKDAYCAKICELFQPYEFEKKEFRRWENKYENY